MSKIRKLIRFARIYGVNRATAKALGRSRMPVPAMWSYSSSGNQVGIIGCGQFAFSTIAYFVNRHHRIAGCYDIDRDHAKSFAARYRCQVHSDPADLLNSGLDVIYIASNHATHTEYAISAMQRGIPKVYVEKPVSVTREQLAQLEATRRQTNAALFSGYNRPHSGAISLIRDRVRRIAGDADPHLPFTLGCFVAGHVIPHDHWYRIPEEGTRICGNVGHWLDLAVHLFNWREQRPTKIDIQLAYSSREEPDDNLNITLTTDLGDLVSITLTARSEPFEGINETINLQYDDLIAKIDDFRRLDLWQGPRKIRKKFFPKDVGHRRAVYQPFSESPRDWQETILSSLIMLKITDMVRTTATEAHVDIADLKSDFQKQVDTAGQLTVQPDPTI